MNLTEKDKDYLIESGIPVRGYSLQQWNSDMEKIKPRFFDTYILPPFIMWFAAKSKMKKWPRRMLFMGGVFMLYRNWSEYRKAAVTLQKGINRVNNANSTTDSNN